LDKKQKYFILSTESERRSQGYPQNLWISLFETLLKMLFISIPLKITTISTPYKQQLTTCLVLEIKKDPNNNQATLIRSSEI